MVEKGVEGGGRKGSAGRKGRKWEGVERGERVRLLWRKSLKKEDLKLL